MISYQRSIVTMGLSRTVSEINGDLSRKSQKFSHHCVLCAPAEGVPLGIGYRRWESKNYNDGPRKKFEDIFSLLDTIHQRDRQTDGRTDRHRLQQRLRLRIASRGKNHLYNVNVQKYKCVYIEISDVV